MTTIQIERLTTGTVIEVPGFGAAEVYECEFDGSGYSVTYCTNDRYGWDCVDHAYFDAGSKVEHAGIGEPRWMRPESDVTKDEWQAKADAIDADILQLQGKINAAQGYVAAPFDEARRAQFFDAVAKALGVDARESEAA